MAEWVRVKSCYYLCLVGTLPTEKECKGFGGCKNCGFYLPDPEPKKEGEPCQN